MHLLHATPIIYLITCLQKCPSVEGVVTSKGTKTAKVLKGTIDASVF